MPLRGFVRFAAGMPKVKSKFYAVRVGRKPGIYTTWAETQEHINKYPNADFKSFANMLDAQEYVKSAVGNIRISVGPRYDPLKPGPSLKSGITHPETAVPSTTIPKIPRLLENPVVSKEPENKVIVYTDGACPNNQTKRIAKAGVGVWFGLNDSRNVSEPLTGSIQTNQRAEITAAIRAFEMTRSDPRLLEIRTDSMYLIKAMTTWHKSWIKNEWRVKSKYGSGKNVMNRDLFERLLQLIDERGGKINWVHVPGHSGVYGNEMADHLAVQGAGMSKDV
jgi:ribonuclease HI